MKIITVLPAYNEAANLDGLLADLGAALGWESHRVILVDDGSTDDTGAIAAGWAARAPVEVITHRPNAGLGLTLRDGLWAAAKGLGPEDVVVTMDADGSHLPAQIPALIAALEGGAGVAIASRFQSGSAISGVPLGRRILSQGARAVGEALLGLPGVRDYTCGFRAIRGAVLLAAWARWGEALITEPGFAASIQLLLRLGSQRAGFAEIPMDLRYDLKASPSKMRIARTITRTLWVIGGQVLSNARSRAAGR